MSILHLSKRKANAISSGILLIGLGILLYTDAWWPGILLVVWAMFAIREFLTNRFYDLFITSAIFLGLFFGYYLHINWSILMPVLLVVGGIYIVFREYYYAGFEDVAETNEEIELELEERRRGK